MQLRCTFCTSMFTIGREEATIIADKFHNDEISHYDAHCPKCHRAQKITKQQFFRAFPNLAKIAEGKE
jgi:hypothetical protein